MESCKDCLSVNVCKNRDIFGDIPTCEMFKDRIRFVELPCKVGDTVYQMVYCYDRKTYPATKYPDHYVEKKVVGIHICDSRLRVNALSNMKYRDYLIVGVGNALQHIPFAKIGKTVFLTKEEAERTLKDENRIVE